jgi:hypothetical protein
MSTFPSLEIVVKMALLLPAPLMPKVLGEVIASVRRKDESWPSVLAASFAFSMAPESWEGKSAHGWLLDESDMVVSEVFWRLGRGISWQDGTDYNNSVYLSASSCCPTAMSVNAWEMRGNRSASQWSYVTLLHYGLDPTHAFANDGSATVVGCFCYPTSAWSFLSSSASPQGCRRVVEVRWHMFAVEHGHAIGNDGADNESRQSGEEAWNQTSDRPGTESCYSREPSRCCLPHFRQPIRTR